MITSDLFNIGDCFSSIYFQADVVLEIDNSWDGLTEQILAYLKKCRISHSLESGNIGDSIFRIQIAAQKCTLDAGHLIPLLALFTDPDASFDPPTFVRHIGNGRFSTFIGSRPVTTI
jgi:hypothetical protein